MYLHIPYIIFSGNANEISQEEEVVVIKESEKDVLDSATIVNDDKLLITYLKDVKEIIKIFNLEGEFIEDVPLPCFGSISTISAKKSYDFFTFTFTSFTYPITVYHYNFNDRSTQLLHSAEIEGFSSNDFIVDQVFYPSLDGSASIPMFLVYPKVVFN